MATSSDDYRPLLSAGFWLAAVAAGLAGACAVAGSSSAALGLALELLLVAVATRAVSKIHRRRVAGHPPEELRKAVQGQAAVLAVSAGLVGLVASFQLLQQALGAAPREAGGVAFAAVCLAGAFVWLVLARALQAIPPDELPEAGPLSLAFREAQWAFLAAAAGLMGALVLPSLALWVGRALFAWVLALAAETLLRLTVPVVLGADPAADAVAPIRLLLREAVLGAGNPVGSLLRTLEGRLGGGVRSSWALAFVKRAALPLLALLGLLLWGSTAVTVVEMDQLGVREDLGRVHREPLRPGLHFLLPWPLGRVRTFSVKTVRQVPIGFVEEEEMPDRKEPRRLLWTRGHAREEFALVLGGGTELVVVNARLYYKIAEDPEGFLDYVYGQAAPEEAAVAFAYRALTEETRGRTLDEVLSADRAAFARRLAESVRRQSAQARLGLEILDLALLNLHPPIEAASSYLDVINARLDARRRVTEAEGVKQVGLLAAHTGSATAVASARVEGTRRVAEAGSQVAEFTAAGQAARVAPQTDRLRRWIEALEKALDGQRLFLIDPTLLGEGGELLLDTRRLPATPLPPPAAMPPSAPSGAKKRD